MATSLKSQNESAAKPVEDSASTRTIASYKSYAAAQRAVDWLSDQGFAVERLAIVGKGLSSVEQVAGRMTAGRGALIGAGQGSLIGALFALLFGIFFTGPDFGGLFLYAVVTGGIFGSLFGALAHAAYSGGDRDFVSETNIAADRYEVQADEEVADEAKRILEAQPAS
jgi:hypothetical protein